ncbi:MAG: 2Fe-2S iron-sulfur cluster-binding protein [Methanospirillum sp.]|uniref:2Fe-2S iron-sulfur cluster-binding protein n=1 Tax=Methanospirillum sp. TaxID=45200 RepID=UPI00236A3C16|nr:2Fe-2S iron-sulfur cluster-binding protein [Methanospirillum sp.]MDD1729390.1 2Fe-2S iron-sulfur cluster-binding protein [Methanospirillum sp.]
MNDHNRWVTITINKNQYQAMEGEIFLSAAMREGIEIPHLCFEEESWLHGDCRLCMVDVVTCGKTEMTTACTLRVYNGLEVLTDMPETIRYRNSRLELCRAESPEFFQRRTSGF